MKRTQPSQSRQRRRRLELEIFRPKAAQGDPDAWIDDLTDDELADLLGPSWAELTGRCADYLVADTLPRRQLA